jgi:hypothetical protein
MFFFPCSVECHWGYLKDVIFCMGGGGKQGMKWTFIIISRYYCGQQSLDIEDTPKGLNKERKKKLGIGNH